MDDREVQVAKAVAKDTVRRTVERDTEPDAGGVGGAGSGKGRATPSRREREAARRRPLVPQDRSEARRIDRTRSAVDRERARVGLANGEERYLPARDKGAQKRFVRDWVDARWSISEFSLPLLLFIVISTFALPVALQSYTTFVMWAFVIVVAVEVFVAQQLVMRRLRARFGADHVERVRWYLFMRMIQLRVLRMPKPQVRRGASPV